MKQLYNLVFSLVLVTGISVSAYSACELYDMTILRSDCNAAKKFTVKINFKYNDVSDCFTISGNGKNYGTFLYANLPIIIDGLDGDCITPYEFVISDCQNNQCHIGKELGKVCCENNCSLSNLVLERTDCDSNNQFFVHLNFSHTNTSPCFKLYVNNDFYKTIEYSQLPVKVGPFNGDCKTKRLFAIKDCENPDCQVKKEMDTVCCPIDCSISNIRIERTPCDSNRNFSAFIAFKGKGKSDSFLIQVNNKAFGPFVYGNPSYKTGPFQADCITKFHILIKDQKDATCAQDSTWGPICCDSIPPTCKLFDPIFEKSECNADKQFYIFLNFKHQGTSDCFKVKGNGNDYGSFEYGKLPLKLGPFNGDCQTAYEFLIQDCHNADCKLGIDVGKVCCETNPPPCKLFDPIFEKSECNADKQFYISLNFKHQETSDCFKVSGNGNNYGTFTYSSLPIKLGPFNGDCQTAYEFLIQDCHNADCKLGVGVGKVCCETNPPPCKLFDPVFEKSECNADKQFYISLNFKHQETSDCFKVSGNGNNYGTFTYSNLPIKLGPFNGDCQTAYEFLIQDCHNADCKLGIGVGKVCCENNPDPCKIYDLRTERSDCDSNGFFKLFINFSHQNNSDCFRLKLNGVNYGEFSYSVLPLRIDSLIGDCKTEQRIVIQDCKDPHCALEKNLGIICCDGHNKECKISEIRMERTECDSNKEFYVFFKVSGLNLSECFKIAGNGHNYGEYRYNNQPVKLGPFKADCTTHYEFVFQDCADPFCRAEKNLGIVCCDGDCKINNLSVSRTPCNSDRMFYALLNFTHSGTSDCFTVRGNGKTYGQFNYSQLPLKIGPLPADCNTEYEFVVLDCKVPNCASDFDLGKVCCDSLDNIFYDYEMARTDCDPDSLFNLKIGFKTREVSDSFHLLINNQLQGLFSYKQIPVTVGPLKADCHTIYEIKIIDQKDSTKRLVRFLERPCCKTGPKPCTIYDLVATPLSCTGPGTYSLKVDFKFSGVTNASFDVFDRSGFIGFFNFSQLPITINDFRKTGKDYDFLKVCENDNDACCKGIEFQTIQCLDNDPGKFDLSNLHINQNGSILSLFSEISFPKDIEFELFDLNGKSLDVVLSEQTEHVLFINTESMLGQLYFLRVKNKEDTKTYKFFRLN